jgi:ABC-type cobalamin/Fe3+-siderophores transport system ATPase subunit
LDLNIRKGEFVCIIGDVGSGKSSLLSAMIGDLLHLDSRVLQNNKENILMDDEHLKKLVLESSKDCLSQPPITMSNTVSYVQQIPWI